MPTGIYDRTKSKWIPWNKGLTKTDERVKINIERATETIRKQYKNGREGTRLGIKHTKETILKLRTSHTGYVMPKLQKEAIGNANRGKKKPPRSDKHKLNLSLNHAHLSGEDHPMFGKRGAKSHCWKGGNVEVKCAWCGGIKSIGQWVFKKHKRHFCSKICQNKWDSVNMIGEKANNWKGGISKEPYPFNFNKELKELIRKRENYKCQLCGMLECENIQKLSIHHIDYDKQNCSPNNLISLCGKCNSKVNFNRNYWTEYFKDLNKLRR